MKIQSSSKSQCFIATVELNSEFIFELYLKGDTYSCTILSKNNRLFEFGI